MKIIALVGSPRKEKGNTAALTDLVLQGVRDEDAESQVVFLPGSTVLPCRGCDVCHRTGGCPQKDDFGLITEKIMDADGVVFATPNYIVHVSAQLKAFIDRCCGIVHCLGFRGKYGAAVVTSGGGEEEPIAKYLEGYMIWTGIVPVGSVWATMGREHQVFSPSVTEDARALGRRLVDACRGKETFPDAERNVAAFKERMRWLINDRKDLWPYEFAYWKTHMGL